MGLRTRVYSPVATSVFGGPIGAGEPQPLRAKSCTAKNRTHTPSAKGNGAACLHPSVLETPCVSSNPGTTPATVPGTRRTKAALFTKQDR